MSEGKHTHEKAAAATAIADGGKFKPADDRKLAALRYDFNSDAAVIPTKIDGGDVQTPTPLVS